MVDTDIERVLIPEVEIRRRVRELAAEVRDRLGPGELTVVGVLTGAFVFLSDLVREIPGPVRIAFIRASSYRDGTAPGALEIAGDDVLDVEGRDVLLVEDIVDTGRTLARVRGRLLEKGARRVASVALLSKLSRREVDVALEFTGFRIPDEFVVGYGLDFAGKYRNLPFVGVIRAGACRGDA